MDSTHKSTLRLKALYTSSTRCTLNEFINKLR